LPLTTAISIHEASKAVTWPSLSTSAASSCSAFNVVNPTRYSRTKELLKASIPPVPSTFPRIIVLKTESAPKVVPAEFIALHL
jgi:hypothetical protein